MNQPVENPLQEDPTLLEYIRQRIRLKPASAPEDMSPPEAEETQVSGARFTWMPLLALVLALVGQKSMEPPGRAWQIGLAFYLLGAGILVWAIWRGEWNLAAIPQRKARRDPWTVRTLELAAAGVLGLAAFTLFGGNQFTWVNFFVWVLAIALLVRAFWLKDEPAISGKEKVKPKLTTWHVLLVLVVGLIVFLRVYQLNQVPSEPFSDHAEKILDVWETAQGQTQIFYPRNTGREAIQMYLTVAVARLFGTGFSFLSLKIGTVLCGLMTLPFIYLLGREFANRNVGMLAMLMAGMAYWGNVISRVGLRFPLYPLFTAPVLYYLIRGLRRSNRNDFILAGVFLGLGLHGYSPFRIVPILVLVAIGLFLVHRQSKGNRTQAMVWLGVLVVTSLFLFLPLMRYWLENPESFSYRAFSRLGGLEQAVPGAWWQVLLSNLWNGLRMFNWSDGEIWVNSIPQRPALDVISGALFIFGSILLVARYLRKRNWEDIFLLSSVLILMLPSILSLAYPAENPALNRAGGALVPVFLIAALALEGLYVALRRALTGVRGQVAAGLVVTLLLGVSLVQNYDLVFKQYAEQYLLSAWNSSEMGEVIRQFGVEQGSTENAWIVPYPYWVDTRLPGVWAGIPDRDFAIWTENIKDTFVVPGDKLFVYNVEDVQAEETLKTLYPQGSASRYASGTANHDFMVYRVPEN